METYEESLKKWENYMMSNLDEMLLLIDSYKNSNLKVGYDFLLKKEADLIRSICDGNLTFVRVFTVYYYLLWNGFFSYKNNFVFKCSKDCINSKPGISIINGEGVCFNIAAHFCDILKYLPVDYSGFVVGMHAKESDNWDSFHPDIKKHSSDDVLNSDVLLNHANVLIMKKDDIYILDPTNFLIYKVLRNDKNNYSFTRVELRINIDLDSSFDDVNQFRDAVFKLKRLNDEFASREYKKCGVGILFDILNIGVNMCCNHMKEILEFRKECDDFYTFMASNMYDFSNHIKNKVCKKSKS